ncbi:MAG: hypothetical protein IJS01_00400 [Lentisphaeria bacterium]|nr:hypothetical protein [Lentisphaeria bacterium]
MIRCTTKKTVLDGKTVLLDFGLDAFANLDVELELAEKTELEIAIGEVVNAKRNRLRRRPGGFRIFRSMKKLCGPGRETFRFEIAPHKSPYAFSNSVKLPAEAETEVIPFRYVEITGGRGSALLTRRELFDDFDDEESFFESSDENLNGLWSFGKYTMKATSAFGLFIDGERERVPYEGDGYWNQLGWFCSSTKSRIAADTIDWLEKFPTWPTEWRLMMPLMVRDYLLYTGDRAPLEKWLRWLPSRLLPELTRADGLLSGDGKVIRDIVDWPPSEMDHYEMGKVNFVPNACFVQALESMADLTGDTKFRTRAEKVRARLREIMVKNGLPVDNPESAHTALHTAVFALWADVMPLSQALETLIRSRGMACSVYGAHFLLEVCFRYGMADHGLALLKSKDLRSWNNMLEKGATMAMEAWDDSFKPNQDWNHAWGAAPACIIPRCVCGIRPVAPGFEKFVCDPAPLALDWKFRQPTPKGPIEAEMRRGVLEVRAPAGCRRVEA